MTKPHYEFGLPKNYWDVVSDNLPNYHRRDDVLESDILTRYLDGDEVNDDDLGWIANSFSGDGEVLLCLQELDTKLYSEALEACKDCGGTGVVTSNDSVGVD